LKVKYRKKFLKELSSIPSSIRKKIEKYVFDTIPKSNSIHEMGKIEKLKGYTGYYKIRFGDYRVGLKVEEDLVIFERVLHRKDIYKYYP
jgi:mRNA interferase RelE/StbE